MFKLIDIGENHRIPKSGKRSWCDHALHHRGRALTYFQGDAREALELAVSCINAFVGPWKNTEHIQREFERMVQKAYQVLRA